LKRRDLRAELVSAPGVEEVADAIRQAAEAEGL
jgi:hypothetical protein